MLGRRTHEGRSKGKDTPRHGQSGCNAGAFNVSSGDPNVVTHCMVRLAQHWTRVRPYPLPKIQQFVQSRVGFCPGLMLVSGKESGAFTISESAGVSGCRLTLRPFSNWIENSDSDCRKGRLGMVACRQALKHQTGLPTELCGITQIVAAGLFAAYADLSLVISRA